MISLIEAEVEFRLKTEVERVQPKAHCDGRASLRAWPTKRGAAQADLARIESEAAIRARIGGERCARGAEAPHERRGRGG
jgi:hypothetical protein